MGDRSQEKTAAKVQRNRTANYDKVVSRAELQSIVLRSTSFSVPNDFYPSKAAMEGLKFGYGVEAENFGFNTETGTAVCVFSCNAEAKRKRKNVISCKAKYFAIYVGLSGCDEAAAQAFVGRVGRFAVYPYFRALVANFAWNADINMPILPVIREPAIRKK